uniref:ADAM metallopeptidase domain 23 n=1 Tax=Naja naja TaxID=35670 RepID=A0A8C6X7Z5_NAJNA
VLMQQNVLGKMFLAGCQYAHFFVHFLCGLMKTYLFSLAIHWNETLEKIETILANEDTAFQQTNNSSSKNNNYSSAFQKEITLPSRLIYYLNKDSESPYHILDTRTRYQQKHSKAVHLAQASFQIEAFGSVFILDLSLNNDLLSADYVEIHYEDDKPQYSKGGEHCYYHGSIRGIPKSKAAISTLRGIFEEIKYLELMIVNDYKMIYKEQLNTRVVLVAVETWSDRDRIHVHADPRQMLHDFSRYRQNFIKQRADAVHLLSNVTFHYKRSSLSYFGGICSVARGVGVNEYGLSWAIAQELSQSLAQNLGIQWEPASRKPKGCDCTESWGGCIMEETGVYHPTKFSKCSIAEYRDFLLRGGGFCLFNRPTKLFDATECGNGYVEPGEDCDCGIQTDCHAECCKKCSLSNGAHCSDGPCCNDTCLFFPRGFECRYAVNECDITEICTGDSGQCPPNLHKQDGFACDSNQGRCYSGECKTRDNQCKYIWGNKASGSHKHCYEKLNTEGTQKGNCGKDGDKWIPCHKHDVFCGLLLCANLDGVPRIGHLQGEIIPTSFFHQGVVVNCSCAHVLLDDETDLGYVEDGTPCGPNMMCMDRRCLSIQSLNISSCPMDANGKVCSGHGVCSNEATCICNTTWAGTDCSMFDPRRKDDSEKPSGPKGPSATNLIIGSIAGAILVAAIVLGGTGWGFKYGPT